MRIRAELTASHDRVWQQLAAPGTWLIGTERVAVARELRAARNCQLCQERKTSLSPGGHIHIAAEIAPIIFPFVFVQIV